MISRNWTGVVRSGSENDYIQHLLSETFPKLKGLEGFKHASILRRKVLEGTEFLIITKWESLESITAFSGQEYDNAVVPAVAEAMMVSYDKKVKHFEIDYESTNLN